MNRTIKLDQNEAVLMIEALEFFGTKANQKIQGGNEHENARRKRIRLETFDLANKVRVAT